MKKHLILMIFLISCGSQSPTNPETLQGNDKCKKAIDLFLPQAANGDCNAEHKVGYMYFTGTCVAQNNNKALDYFYKAANQGHPKAQIILGNLFYQNKNDPTISSCPDCQLQKDLSEALKWYTLATRETRRQTGKTTDESFLRRVIGDIQKEIPEKKNREAKNKIANFKYTPSKCNFKIQP
ncbi:MAG: sel1 repeat family protein [Bdellovibrionales bacterium]|nr:sel1 repeat family protein [Bdellovibrionales bacterium]